MTCSNLGLQEASIEDFNSEKYWQGTFSKVKLGHENKKLKKISQTKLETLSGFGKSFLLRVMKSKALL